MTESFKDKIAMIVHRANEKSDIHEEDRLSVPEATDMIIELIETELNND